ncbi:SGNH hydrolase domain-containing protein, partial [Kluyvera sp. Awk 3]|uniref:SGNH hydrolase domain-containing protein n=1 Tax=Kluyvera sp. Awk 3 TaxID=2963956 RepID=UPI0023041C72
YKERVLKSGEFHENEYGGNGYATGTPGIIGDKNSKPTAIMLGDSYARQYAYAADAYLKRRSESLITSFQDGCYFSSEYTTIISGKPNIWCKKDTLSYAIKKSHELGLPVIVSVHWVGYYSNVGKINGERINFKTHDDYISFVKKSIIELAQSVTPNKIVFIGSQPGMLGSLDINSCISRPDYLPLNCTNFLTTTIKKDDFEEKMNQGIINALKGVKNASYVDTFKYICSNGICGTMDDSGRFIYSDSAHLSKAGAIKIWPGLYDD